VYNIYTKKLVWKWEVFFIVFRDAKRTLSFFSLFILFFLMSLLSPLFFLTERNSVVLIMYEFARARPYSTPLTVYPCARLGSAQKMWGYVG